MILKNTYILCKEAYHSWNLFYLNEKKELKPINTNVVPELEMMLIGRDLKHIKSSHKEAIKKIISDYHNQQFSGKFSYYHNIWIFSNFLNSATMKSNNSRRISGLHPAILKTSYSIQLIKVSMDSDK